MIEVTLVNGLKFTLTEYRTGGDELIGFTTGNKFIMIPKHSIMYIESEEDFDEQQ